MILDIAARTLREDGKMARLTKTHVRIIEALALANNTMTINDLIAFVWADRDLDDAENTLSVQVCKMRQRIASAGIDPLIQTLWGVGFRITRTLNVVRPCDASVILPPDIAKITRRLCETHPNHVLADRVLAHLVTA